MKRKPTAEMGTITPIIKCVYDTIQYTNTCENVGNAEQKSQETVEGKSGKYQGLNLNFIKNLQSFS